MGSQGLVICRSVVAALASIFHEARHARRERCSKFRRWASEFAGASMHELCRSFHFRAKFALKSATTLVVYVLVAAAVDSHAQSRGSCEERFSFESLRAYALSHSPLVAEIDRDFAREVARAFDLEVLANPEVSAERVFTRMNLGGASDPQTNAALSQPLRLSNFGKRDRVARLMRSVGDVGKRAKLLEFNQRLLVQYANLYVAQQSERLLSEGAKEARGLMAQVDKSAQQGLISDGAGALFEAEQYRLEAMREGMAVTVSSSRAELGVLVGATCTIKLESAPLLAPLPAEDVLVQRARESELSEASRNELRRGLAREEVELSRMDAFPIVSPRLVYQHTNDGGDFLGFGVTLPLPLWNRNQSENMRAEAEVQAAETRRAYLGNGGLESQVRHLREATIRIQRQTEIYGVHVVGALKRALKSEERVFRQGQGGVGQVWQALRALNEARMTHLGLIASAVSMRAQLSVLIGEEV